MLLEIKANSTERRTRKTTGLKSRDYDGWVALKRLRSREGHKLMVMNEKLDKEWILLISKARQMGLTADEVRSFLRQVPLEANDSVRSEN